MQDKLKQARANIVDCPARNRIKKLFDENSFTELDKFSGTNSISGVITGYGTVEGREVYAFSQNTEEQSGAMTREQYSKIKKVYELALKTGCPIVSIYDSKGLKLDNELESMAAYGEFIKWSSNLSGVVPQIAIIAGTCSGAAAMSAVSSDIVIMAETAELFITAPFTADALGDKTKGAGSAKNSAISGTAHIIADTDMLAIEKARIVLTMLPSNNLSIAPLFSFSKPDKIEDIFDADSEIELFKEFGKNTYTALCGLGGNVCGVAKVNGRLSAKDCSKLTKFMSICDSFNIPVATFVDTKGFEQSSEAELDGSIRAAANLAGMYAEATTPKVAIITGDAVGSVYIALAGKASGADIVYAWENASISALETATAVALFEGDKITAENTREAVEKNYRDNFTNPFISAEKGYIDDIITAEETREKLLSAFNILKSKRETKLPKKHNNLTF